MAYATVEQLESRWRPLTPGERSRAAVLLDDAAVRLDAAYPPSDPATAHELAVREIVSCEMVKRAMAGPEGLDGVGVTSLQMGAGPYQQTTQFSNPTGDLYLTRADKRLLGGGVQKAFTVDLLEDYSS